MALPHLTHPKLITFVMNEGHAMVMGILTLTKG